MSFNTACPDLCHSHHEYVMVHLSKNFSRSRSPPSGAHCLHDVLPLDCCLGFSVFLNPML